MDRKLNNPRFALCKKPHEKRPIRREITFFLKVLKMAIFRKFSFGPPFAILRKMAIFNTFRKNVISRLIGLFSCGFLHSANLGLFSFRSILIRLLYVLFFLFFSLPKFFQKWPIFWSNFARLKK